jgi:FkbM family methyltransferase
MNFDRFEYLKIKGFNPKKILDVGAHMGTVSKQMKELWPDADILMIEANSVCESELKSTGIPYKICLLGNEKENSKYYMTKKWSGSSGNSMYRELTNDYNDENIEVIELPVFKLDNILPNESYDLIKIDTQGSEIDILSGGLNIISKVKYIITECSIMDYNKGGCKIHQIFDFMTKNNLFVEDIIDLSYKENDLCQIDLLFKKL